MLKRKKWTAIVVAIALFTSLLSTGVQAKTVSSSRGDNLFFYASDRADKRVLISVTPLEELKKQAGSEHYYYSSTDNYPTTQYSEGVGLTIPALVSYLGGKSTVKGAGSLAYGQGDSMAFMATDSYGSYSRAWAWDKLYGTPRYYFEGLYDEDTGWRTAWEIGDEQVSKFGIDLDTYQKQYAASDPFYEQKKAVFEGGVAMPVILATESYSGRTTTSTLTASTEPGIAAQLAANGGKAAGSLKDVLTDDTALRLCIPMTQADLMVAHRTAYDNFKWIYNLRLDMENSPITSQGTVPAPKAQMSVKGDTLTITLSSEVQGSRIYYSFDGAPQTQYTGPIQYDVKGRILASNPVTLSMTAVREGYDDAGVVFATYPQSGVAFEDVYSAMTGEDVTFTAKAGVTDQDWQDWSKNVLGLSVKAPGSSSYVALKASDYTMGTKSITLQKSLFSEAGTYSILCYAKGFSNKNLTVTMRRAAPTLSDLTAALGQEITLTFTDDLYQSGLYLYLIPADAESGVLISPSYIERGTPGRATIKAEFFASASCPIQESGNYTLELVNHSYFPATQRVALTIGEGGTYADVVTTAWYAQAVDFVTERGLFSGTGGGRFSPDATMTRSMFTAVLWRLEEQPAPKGQSPFTDVAAGTWYANAVIWASEGSHVSGTGGKTFTPEGEITLEQMTAILWRNAARPAATGTLSSRFANASSWAAEALIWGEAAGLFEGVEGTLAPTASATRSQVAHVFMNYCTIVNK